MNKKSDDVTLIKYFEHELEKRKRSANSELWLTDLKDIFEAITSHLNASETTIKYIDTIIKNSIKTKK